LCWLHVTSKIMFCYHLPTRGWAGVKLGDAWYVANVSIIFDAPCLFYTNCRHFYAFSGTNLLTRCQCQFLFCAVFVFQKSYTGNILGIGQNKSQTSYFSRHEDGVQSRYGGGHRGSHTIGWRAPSLAVPPCGVGSSDIALPPINYLRRKNPKSIGIHPRKVPHHRRHRRPISGDRSLYFGTLPGWGITSGTISINSTAISIVVAVSHDEEGVVLPRG
jgi:hypothetical protein